MLFQSTIRNYIILICLVALISFSTIYFSQTYGQENLRERPFSLSPVHPHVFNSGVKVEQVAQGLDTPTTMAFVGPDDFLVLEKDKGTVIRVVNGRILEKPLLDVDVANSVERGMCGIAVFKTSSKTYVFLYFTEINGKDGDDRKGKEPEGNRLYRYELVDDRTDGIAADGRSGILRVTQDGKPVGEGILRDSMPLRLYYAYGIRNSFGLDFDPITGSLWDTENGPHEGDEINLVNPGFKCGWQEIVGFSSSQKKFDVPKLVTFDGKGKYEEPKLVWVHSTGLTSLIFFDSEKLGTEYRNDMFVGDVHNERIYNFKFNDERNDLLLPKALAGKFIENPTNLADLLLK